MTIRLCYLCEATSGGVRKHLLALMRCFARPEEGFEVHALLGDRGEPGLAGALETLRGEGVRVSVLPQWRREIAPLRDWRAYRAIKRWLREREPEIVHTHSSKAGFLGRLAAAACRVPRIIHTPHVFPFSWAHGPEARFYLALERYAARRCGGLVCVGEHQKEEALKRRLAPPEKLHVIPNGVALPEAARPEEIAAQRRRLDVAPGAPCVGMIARLAPQKDVGTFLEAAAEARQRRSDAVFVLVGGGPLERQVRARAAALGLERGALKILGYVPDAERLYPAFDILALSSLYEGLPYVLLEAMAWGVPVVATDVLGSSEVLVGGETGLLAPPGDPAGLARQMLRLLDDAALRARLGKAARARVERSFSHEAFLDGHRRLYREAG